MKRGGFLAALGAAVAALAIKIPFTAAAARRRAVGKMHMYSWSGELAGSADLFEVPSGGAGKVFRGAFTATKTFNVSSSEILISGEDSKLFEIFPVARQPLSGYQHPSGIRLDKGDSLELTWRIDREGRLL